MVKKVSAEKNPATHDTVTGWRSLLIQVLQILIGGLQSIQSLVEKTAPRMTEANNSLTTIREKIEEKVVVKQDETIEQATQVLTEIADQSEKNLGEVSSEVFASIDSNVEKVQENLSDSQAIDLTIVEATKKVEAVKDLGKKNINSFQQTKQKITSIWQNLISNIRPLLSKSWQEKLSDSMISALMTTTLITILVVSIVIGAALIPMTPPSIALEQTDQNIRLDNNDISLQPINIKDKVSDNISNNRLDIMSDSDQSNISEGDSKSEINNNLTNNLTNNADLTTVQPTSNTQIALLDEVSENNLNNNSELPEIEETPIKDDYQDQFNQKKLNKIDDLVTDNSIADSEIENSQAELAIDQEKVNERSLNTEIRADNIELDTQDNQLNDQSSQTTDDISAPDTGIANETKDSENIKSSELANELTNNLTDSLPPMEKSNNNLIKNENISAPVQQIIPTELTTEADLPVEKTQVEPEPVKFTPEQYLVISIKNQIADITNLYGGGMVDSIQVNFLSGLLVIQVTDDWYDLDKTAQNQLANNLFKQAQDLDFTKLQIADTTGKLVARSPVVGEQMIILARSQSGI
jgi:hypothetical protein